MFTYPLHAKVVHIRPLHSVTNQLCRLLQCIPHSRASILLFLSLSLLSSSMLSWALLHIVISKQH